MRDLVFVLVILPLLGMATVRPFVGVLVWSWISFMNPHQLVWGATSTLPWAAMTFVVTVIGCVVAREPKRIPLNAVTVLMGLLIVGITLTSFTALGPADEVWAKWDRTFKVLLGLLLTAALLDDKRRIHALIWLIVISLGFFGVKGGLFTLLTGGGFIVMGPPNSMITDRNHLATALLVSIPLMNYLRLQSRHRVVRQGLVFAMATTLMAVVGSQSRGALVALIVTGAVLWSRSRGKVLSGVAIAVAGVTAIAFMPETWVERMETIKSYQEDGSAMGRLTIWEASIRIALMRPLVGGGFLAMYKQNIVNRVMPEVTARAAHSIWFETLGEHGFVVFAIWLGILIAGGIYSLRITRQARGRPELRWAYDLARMSQVSAAAYMAGGSFLSLGYWDCFWTLLVVLGSVHDLLRQHAGKSIAAAAPAGTAGWRVRAAASVPPAAAARGTVVRP